MIQPLAEAIFWIAALACVLAEVAILRSSFAETGAHSSALVPVSSRRSELAWTILPALGLAVLLMFTWREVNARKSHAAEMHNPANPSSPGHVHDASAP